jgi:hypothetical protein
LFKSSKARTWTWGLEGPRRRVHEPSQSWSDYTPCEGAYIWKHLVGMYSNWLDLDVYAWFSSFWTWMDVCNGYHCTWFSYILVPGLSAKGFPIFGCEICGVNHILLPSLLLR